LGTGARAGGMSKVPEILSYPDPAQVDSMHCELGPDLVQCELRLISWPAGS
jgi:hypothetical protein